jgi:hypothetical protein
MDLEANAEVVEVEVEDPEPITIGEVTEVTGAMEAIPEGDDNVVWGT